MPSLTEDLLLTLEKQTALYDQVLALMDQERTALLSRKPQDVLDLVRHKETILLKIRTLDESRQLVCLRLAKLWALPVAQITLSVVESRSDEVLASQVSAVRYRMMECLERLRAANEINATLCRRGIETIELIMQTAFAATPTESLPTAVAPATYGRSGRLNGGGTYNSKQWR
jgi:flagellar biosynthesis/type III secretory pathway chaperone